MKKATVLFIALLSLTILISSCSKTVELKDSLTSGDGRWNIYEVKVTTTVTDDPVPVISDRFDVGEVLFFTTGNGLWVLLDTLTGLYGAEYFEWENTDKTISVTFKDTVETEYNITVINDDEQDWENSVTRDLGGGTFETVDSLITIKRNKEIANK